MVMLDVYLCVSSPVLYVDISQVGIDTVAGFINKSGLWAGGFGATER
jgi:hypothetical protein